MAKPIKDQLTKRSLGKRFFSLILVLVSCCLYSQQTTTWTPINLNTWESLSSDGLVRVECRVTGSVIISGNETMGCTSDNTYNDPTPDIFGSPSLEISVGSLLTGTLEFHFFDATTGNPVYLTNPFVNVDKVGTYGILPFPLLNGTNTGVFTLTNETWTNISSNGPIFQATDTQFQIDAAALLSSNGGECGNGVDQGTGGGTMRMDTPVQSIEMGVSVSGSLISFNENVEFVLSNLIIAEPSIEVTKAVTENYSTPISIGDEVNYTIQVENTGNVEIINIELTDTFTDANGNPLTLTSTPSFISATMGSGEGTLKENEIATYAAGYTFDGNAIDAGGVINQVTAMGDSPYGPNDTFDTSDDGNDSDGNLLDDLTESFFPVPQDDMATVEEDDSLDILVITNDDFGGNGPNTGSIILISTPTNGTIILNNDSTPNNPVDDYFTYTPNIDYSGSDSFVYGILDSKGHTQYATVTITIFACPDAGTDGTLNICQGDTFDNDDLFAQLGGSPDAGGTWTDNGDGTHTYTVLATLPCTTDDSSTVTVTQQARPNAGTDGTLNICQGDTFDNDDLFAQLGGSPDAGGTWTDNGDGTHTYTVLATLPCTTDDSSTVTVTQQARPDAGTDGTLNICQGDTFDNDDLFAQLGGSPDAGGTWTDNGDGTHTYTVLATLPCTTDDSSTVTVTQQARPDAGTDGTLNICQGDTFDNDDLFAQLGGSPDAGGTWTDNGDGTHTYTVLATLPCTTDDSSTVTVTQQARPDAGTDGTLNICQGDTFDNDDLFAQLGGSPDAGGTWTDNGDGTHTYTVLATLPCTTDDSSTVTVTQQARPDAGTDGTLNICQGDTFDNDDLFAQLGGSPDAGGTWTDNGDGTHTYTVLATLPCTTDDSSTVTVTQQARPDAGTDGTLNICQGDTFDNDDLFAQLGGSPDAGGTWTDNGDGTHTYTVLATLPCTTDDSSTVTVTQQARPDAGTDGTLNICQGDTFDNDDLFAQLGGSPDAGGTWTDNGDGTHTYTVLATLPCTTDDSSTVTVTQQARPDAGTDGTLNICQGDTFDNDDLFAQLGGSPDAGGTWTDNGDGTHTYTVLATLPCTTDDSSTVTVTQQARPDAGTDGTLNICQGDTFDNDDLFAQLGGSPDAGGTWTDNGDGTHTYTVLATLPCTTDDSSTVTVTQQARPDAGTDGTLNICQGDTFDNDDLFAQLGGSPDAGGTWTDNGDGTHTYTVLATLPCTTDDSSTVTVTQQARPDAGTDGTLNICQGDTFDNDDLFAQLGGSPDAGGTWTDNGDGTHTYTVLATLPCTTDDSSTVTVTQQARPNAGTDGTLNICQGDTFDNDDLFAQLGGSPDAGGTWTDNGDGTHTYTVLATLPCTTDDSSTVIVSINQTDSNNNGIADCTETIPVQLIIDIDSITADNIINEQESLETITITGNVSGDFNEGDIVTLSINNTNYTGAVDSNGNFNISVSGSDLVSDIDTSILGTITTINNNGNTGSASVQHPYTIDTGVPLVESFTTRDSFPILLGSGSSNEIITITVTIDNIATPIIYVINTDINGIWAIDTSTEVPHNGSFPTIDAEAILSITATDIAGNTGIGEVIIIFENVPLTADSDNDGLPDDEEVRIGTDPSNPDTDGDGVVDGQEVSDGTDPLDPCDSVGGTPPTGSTCELYVELDLVKPGDNINGNFEIINIERFPNNTVKIYNRWGVKVWETQGYENITNAFNGISNGRTTIMQNEELPSGVYYYDIQYEAQGEQKLLTGYLYVIR